MLSRRHFLAASLANTLAVPLIGSSMSSAAAAVDAKPLLIDSHVHVWKHDPQYPFAPGRMVPPEDRTAEMLLDLMKANGVSRTVIIQVIHYTWDNRYLADVLKRYPGIFKGVCRVNPEDPANADQLSKLVEEQGFHGVRLSPAGDAQGDWIKGPYDGASMAPLRPAQGADDHPGSGNPDAGFDTADRTKPRSYGRDRPYGRFAARSPRTVADVARSCPLSQGLCENFSHVVAFQTSLSLRRFAGSGQTALRRFWSETVDVGHRLADLSGPVAL